MWAYRFRRAEMWRDEEKGSSWTTWVLDWVPGLRIADVLRSMPCVRPAPRRSPPAPYSEVRRKSSLHVARARLRPLLAGSLYRSSPAAATKRRSWQLKLHSRESVKPINVANWWVNQRSQINEDTVEPSLAAQDINPITYAPDSIFFAPRSGFVPG